MRVAVLADTHGNLLALEALLADLRGQAPDLVVNLGDVASIPRPGWQRRCADRVRVPDLAGNLGRNLVEGDDTSGSVSVARPCCRQLTGFGSAVPGQSKLGSVPEKISKVANPCVTAMTITGLQALAAKHHPSVAP